MSFIYFILADLFMYMETQFRSQSLLVKTDVVDYFPVWGVYDLLLCIKILFRTTNDSSVSGTHMILNKR